MRVHKTCTLIFDLHCLLSRSIRDKSNQKVAISGIFNPFPNKPWFLHVFSTSLLKTLWEKGDIARNEQFLLFPTVFSTPKENFLPSSSNLKLSSANSFNLEEPKIYRLGKG